MAIPTYDKLMLPLLKLLSDKKIYNLKTCEKELAKQFKITDEELNEKVKTG